ncbi:hypothetical protein HGA91_00055 [candidate division WWE3 bacterium]|nr:hypothetical protein [candidate division WWE3 bacterium]
MDQTIITPQPHPRPYWFVDAKWIVSIILFITVLLTIPTYALYKVSEEQPAKQILTYVVAYLFSPDGIDHPDEIKAIRQHLLVNPNPPIEIFDGFALPFTYDEVADRSPKEIRLEIFGQISKALYEMGPESFTVSHIKDVDMQKIISENKDFIYPFTQLGHQQIQQYLIGLGVFSGIMLGFLMIFSHRYGRLITPGVIFCLSGLPTLLINRYQIGKETIDAIIAQPIHQGYPFLFKYLGIVIPFGYNVLAETFSIVLITGVGLIFLAIFVKLITLIVGWIIALFTRETNNTLIKEKPEPDNTGSGKINNVPAKATAT